MSATSHEQIEAEESRAIKALIFLFVLAILFVIGISTVTSVFVFDYLSRVEVEQKEKL